MIHVWDRDPQSSEDIFIAEIRMSVITEDICIVIGRVRCSRQWKPVKVQECSPPQLCLINAPQILWDAQESEIFSVFPKMTRATCTSSDMRVSCELQISLDALVS